MTRARIAAGAAGIVTVLLLQATVVAPAAAPWPVSLPAVLVAVVALVDGPATGMSFGFATGLLADLGSRHPAGVLALSWLAVGLLCGLLAERHSVRRDALVAGVVCGAAGVAAGTVLVAVHRGGVLRDVFAYALPATGVEVLLAFALVPLARRMLRSTTLRAPQPVPDLLVGVRRG